MARHVLTLVLGVSALAAFGQPALDAHHSFAAQYDSNKPVTLEGTITKVEWMNPHTYFYLDAVDDTGKSASWSVEGGAPNVLYRQGWKPTSLKQGDRVTIVGSRAKDGSNLANAIAFMLPDGRCVFAGTSGPAGSGTPNCPQGGRGR
jgi:predicted Rossmann fold nucleotide-binding protein DprA/Smf involved in DNA uptake